MRGSENNWVNSHLPIALHKKWGSGERMVRVGILGATGYTALELIKLLLRHPEVEIRALTSRQDDSPHVAQVHPQLATRLDLRLQPLVFS